MSLYPVLRHSSSAASGQRTGAMLPLIAVVIVILLVASALAIDIASMHVARSELRTATDAAAKAAVEALGREQSQTAAINAALRIAKENRVSGTGLDLDPSQIVFGISTANDSGRFIFREDSGVFGAPINSVQVTGARTAGSPNGPISLMFGSFFGVSSFEPRTTAIAAHSERDIALVLDVSGSMADFGRFPALRNALDVFLNELDSSPHVEQVSLSVYSTTARKRVDLTSDLNRIRTAFATEIPLGFTAIGQGLQLGRNSLLSDANSRRFALKTVVLMTDGNHNRGVEPAVIAADCARNNIQVHTVTFSRDADLSRMRDVARIAGGVHFHANTNEELIEQFRLIARQLKVVLIK